MPAGFWLYILTIKDSKKVGLVGLNDEFFSLYINKVFETQDKSILIVTSTLYEANLLNTFWQSKFWYTIC